MNNDMQHFFKKSNSLQYKGNLNMKLINFVFFPLTFTSKGGRGNVFDSTLQVNKGDHDPGSRSIFTRRPGLYYLVSCSKFVVILYTLPVHAFLLLPRNACFHPCLFFSWEFRRQLYGFQCGRMEKCQATHRGSHPGILIIGNFWTLEELWCSEYHSDL